MIISQVHRYNRDMNNQELDNIIYLRYMTLNNSYETYTKKHVIHLPATKENIIEFIQHDFESIKQYVQQKYVSNQNTTVVGVNIKHSIMYDIDHTFVDGIKHDNIQYKYMVVGCRHDLKDCVPKNLKDEVFVKNVCNDFNEPAWNYFTNNIKFMNYLKLTQKMNDQFIHYVAIARLALDEFDVSST